MLREKITGPFGFLLLLLLIPGLFLLAAGIIKFAWWVTGMGDWTGLGIIPWGPAFFMALLGGGIIKSK